ncbi:MAG: histidine triad nucleotide-binding protein [Oscillospiraceae bacterium]|nr:histidine triad nucleotide-binding protein [Oscillospiraceae bacterium]
MSTDCLFCKIVAGEIPSDKIYEDDAVLAFRDIAPQAPVHILVIPKAHVASAMELSDKNTDLVAACFAAIPQIAKEQGLENGFRVITNCGQEGGQTVFHLHFHILGGRQLGANLL